MRPFTFAAPATLADALGLLQEHAERALPVAGGSDVIGLLKDDVVHYEHLVSLADIVGLHDCHLGSDGWHIGALVTLAELEHDTRLQGPYRMLAEAARGLATPEIRNQGTLGGNLCQRPRCFHYCSALIPCLKKGDTVWPAIESPHQQYLSVMGGTGCFCVHASDLAPVLIVMGAHVLLDGASGQRSMSLESFFTGPDQDVQRENVLMLGEVITAVTIPVLAEDWRGTFLKARERTAGDFPLVSVAIGFTVESGVMQQARVVLGGVAPVPWRSLAAEVVLEGKAPSEEVAYNDYKIDIGRSLVARAIQAAYSV